ncbi:hypothetical protein MFIFM68171_02679 [Madurella fahalii]|uniref:Uncharacterized protein n=1 Tax=Madurella fahalii TaxID=1157608 RepID=A0ABQ0G3Z5_9PEZI
MYFRTSFVAASLFSLALATPTLQLRAASGPCPMTKDNSEPCRDMLDSSACWNGIIGPDGGGSDERAEQLWDCVPGGKEYMCGCYGCDSGLDRASNNPQNPGTFSYKPSYSFPTQPNVSPPRATTPSPPAAQTTTATAETALMARSLRRLRLRFARSTAALPVCLSSAQPAPWAEPSHLAQPQTAWPQPAARRTAGRPRLTHTCAATAPVSTYPDADTQLNAGHPCLSVGVGASASVFSPPS